MAPSQRYTVDPTSGTPRYNPKYPEHPPCGVRIFTDGQTPDSKSDWRNDAIALPTLAIYTSTLHTLLALFVASFFWRPAAIAFGVLLATTVLPVWPMRWQAFVQSRVFACWRRYFHFSFYFEEDLDDSSDYLFAQFPHGAFPLGPMLGGTSMACEFPHYKIYLMAASSVFRTPFWRHIVGWMGAVPATRKHFKRLVAMAEPKDQPAGATAAAGEAAGAAGDKTGAAAAAAAAAAVEPLQSSSGAAAAAAAAAAGTAEGDLLVGENAEELPQAAGVANSHEAAADTAADNAMLSSRATSIRQRSGLNKLKQSCERTAHGEDAQGEAAIAALVPKAKSRRQQQEQEQRRQEQQGKQGVVAGAAGRSRQGTGIGLVVGGIAEMFIQAPAHEAIYLRNRKGFVALALEAGIDIVPVYSFGNSALLSYRAPQWLAAACRRLGCSVGLIYGRWGLVIPRKLPIMFTLGRIVRVGAPMSRQDPGFSDRVQELHGQVVAEVERLYDAHKGMFGWEDWPLVVL